MKKAIEILETIPDSSVYGEAADKAYAALIGKTSALEIYSVAIPDADMLLRNLTSIVTTMSLPQSTNVARLIAAIPSVTAHSNYI